MIKRPIYEGPEARRRRLVSEFLAKYPHPFFAWAERQSPFWRMVLSRHLTPEAKAILIAGAWGGQSIKVPRMRELWDYYFRAAWTTMVTKEDRSWDDFTAEALAEAFNLTRGRYQKLVKSEKQWQRRQAMRPVKELKVGRTVIPYTQSDAPNYLSSVLPKLAELPAIEELVKRLLTLPTK